MVSKAQLKAYQKYADKAYDRLAIRVPKGERDRFAEYAADCGVSMAEYVRRACYKANPGFIREFRSKSGWLIHILDNDMMVAESLQKGYNWKVVSLTANIMSEMVGITETERLLEMMDQWHPIIKAGPCIRCTQDKDGKFWLTLEDGATRYRAIQFINTDNVGWDGKEYFYFPGGVESRPRHLAEFLADK